MKKLIVSSFAVVFALAIGGTAASAQTVPASTNPNSSSSAPISEGELMIMRSDLRSEKKKLIAMNVPLTEQEATKFWPVYDQYVEDMRKVNDEFYKTVRDYSLNNASWTDAQASAMLDKWVKLQMEQAKTRQKYIPLIEKAIPAKKAALFFQIDRRLYTLMDLQSSTYLPLTSQ